MFLPSLLLFLLQLTPTAAWQRYEQPIEIATPNENGVYEFDLVVAHKMTMTRPAEWEHVNVLDFEPETESWMERISDQLAPCNASRVLIRPEATEAERENMLKDVIQLDGLHHRMITINGETPGKPIVVPLGAEVVMRVRNRLNTEAVTLHVHGLDKRHLWFMDGVSHIQQCPIVTGSDFTYRFIADAPGTHWYHGHLNSDRGEGLLGGFVVKNVGETVPDPEEDGKRIVIARDYYAMLQDWSKPWPVAEQHYNLHDHTMKWVNGMDGEERQQCWAPTRTFDGSNVGGSIPMSSFLVNDKGWHNPEDLKTRASKLPLPTFLIKKGEDILVRFVNGGVAQQVFIWLEGHEMTVVAADGVEVKPRTVDSLIIFSGERYDVVIRAVANPTRKQYRFIFETMEAIHWNWGPYKPFRGLANLEYEDVGVAADDHVDWSHSDCTQERKCRVLNCPFGQFGAHFNYTCISAHLLENAQGVTDAEIVQQKKFGENFDERTINMHFDSHVNGYMFKKPQGMPYYNNDNLDQISTECKPSICDREHTVKYDHKCDCFINYYFKLNDIVQLTIYNMGDGGKAGTGYAHPFHLHGTHFWVMKMAYPEYHRNGTVASMNDDLPCTANQRCLDLTWANATWTNGDVPGMQRNPSFRDTILIPTGGYTVIRFRANNPGWWFAHCHLMLHHMGGTAFSFRVGEHEDVPVPPDNFPHDCGVFDYPKLALRTERQTQAVAM